MIEQLIQRPAFPLWFGTSLAIGAAIAIYGLGSPPWVLAPIAWVGVALFAELAARFGKAPGQRGSS